MQVRRAQPSETEALKEWIAANHYLQSAPPGFVQLLEFIEGKDRIGGMIIGRPSAKPTTLTGFSSFTAFGSLTRLSIVPKAKRSR